MDRRAPEPMSRGAGPRVVVLTGAGISAESGIPTFRGPEGYWTVGSAVYRPEALATHAAFVQMPEIVWPWYLHRLAVCRRAAPNAAHAALVTLEQGLNAGTPDGSAFLLVTQNVDGLHARAGSQRLYEIHGNIGFARCDRCAPTGAAAHAPVPRRPIDDRHLPPPGAPQPTWTAELAAALTCACGELMRPHVLWFDEYYDEATYRFASTLAAVRSAAVLVIVGTSGATNLPNQMARLAAASGVPILELNPEDTPFTPLALRHGRVLRGPATALLPDLVQELLS